MTTFVRPPGSARRLARKGSQRGNRPDETANAAQKGKGARMGRQRQARIRDWFILPTRMARRIAAYDSKNAEVR